MKTLLAAFLALTFLPVLISADTKFIRGDANADGKKDIADAIQIVYFVALSGPASTCQKAADLDDNGAIELSDAVYFLNWYFLNKTAPKAPFPACGTDPTADSLTCVSFKGCP